MDTMGIKPNYAALGREYGYDWRTVKKYHEGYAGKPKTRNKSSKLDCYFDEISDKLKIKRVSVTGVYKFMVNKYGKDKIGSYQNFNSYVHRKELKTEKSNTSHPRFETLPGKQAQADWKEKISMVSKKGEEFTINIFHIELGFSRYSYLELSVSMQSSDVYRCLTNSFQYFGGVPEEVLFDNMTTVATITKTEKKLTNGIKTFAKDFTFSPRLCGVRSPETKGQVEARNKIVDWLRPYQNEFDEFEDLIGIVESINKQMNLQICQGTNMSPVALYYKEKEHLQPLPRQDIIDRYLSPNKYLVASDGLFRYAGCKYSVGRELIGKEVTVDELDGKLHVYYMGKLVAFHQLSSNPTNYLPEHYEELMIGKVRESDMEKIVRENLETMDRLLETRKVDVTANEATSSEEALIAYLSKSSYGNWIINWYAEMSDEDRHTFVTGMNEVLPYVCDDEEFISHIKFSMKNNMCAKLAMDCVQHDTFPCDTLILTDEGYDALAAKHPEEYKEMREFFHECMSGVCDDEGPSYFEEENENIRLVDPPDVIDWEGELDF